MFDCIWEPVIFIYKYTLSHYNVCLFSTGRVNSN